MDTFISQALIALTPTAAFYIEDEDLSKLVWEDTEIARPSDSAIRAKAEELKKEWESKAYARLRKDEYPEMGIQLNYIYDHGIDKWKTDIVDPIKKKYPKPE
tara:strand:+ start:479 stop:784 length:306 start_codon:yes stop_codon:yes gene_type:complete